MNMHDDNAFDAALRRLHAQALDSTSARTRAQLQQRHRAAFAAGGPAQHPRRYAWPLLATAAAAAMALAVIGVVPPGRDASPQTARPAAAIGDDAGLRALAVLDDTSFQNSPPGEPILDESPDLYLWLASNDAGASATEMP